MQFTGSGTPIVIGTTETKVPMGNTFSEKESKIVSEDKSSLSTGQQKEGGVGSRGIASVPQPNQVSKPSISNEELAEALKKMGLKPGVKNGTQVNSVPTKPGNPNPHPLPPVGDNFPHPESNPPSVTPIDIPEAEIKSAGFTDTIKNATRASADYLGKELETLQRSYGIRLLDEKEEKNLIWWLLIPALVAIIAVLAALAFFVIRKYREIPPQRLPAEKEKGTSRIIELQKGIPYYVVRDRNSEEIIDSFALATGCIDEAHNYPKAIREMAGAEGLELIQYLGAGEYIRTEDPLTIFVHRQKKADTTIPFDRDSGAQRVYEKQKTKLLSPSLQRFLKEKRPFEVIILMVTFLFIAESAFAIFEYAFDDISSSQAEKELQAREDAILAQAKARLIKHYSEYMEKRKVAAVEQRQKEIQRRGLINSMEPLPDKPELDPMFYLNRFYQAKARFLETAQFGVKEEKNLRFVFQKEIAGWEATCGEAEDGSLEMTLNTQYWERESNDDREVTIFHEVGHCLFKLDHSASGIMYHSGVSNSSFKKYRDYYLKQFFAQTTTGPFLDRN